MNTIADSQILQYNEDHWCDLITLSEESLEYFWAQIKYSQQSNVMYNHMLAGNISKSLAFFDNENFIPNRLFKDIISNKLDFYSDKIRKNLTQPVLTGSWINFQKKYEFNPIHDHHGILSFVSWLQIPYNWEDEKDLEIVRNSNFNYSVGNFAFVYCEQNKIKQNFITMNSDMQGRMVVFPSYFNHMVYPFYTSDLERISVSGNIEFE